MRHSLHFPWVIESGESHTELSIDNPFARLSAGVARCLKGNDAGPELTYAVVVCDSAGRSVATVPPRPLRPLAMDHLTPARVLAAAAAAPPFVGSLRIDDALRDDSLDPTTAWYLQVRAEVYDDTGRRVITDHGQQQPGPEQTAVYIDAALAGPPVTTFRATRLSAWFTRAASPTPSSRNSVESGLCSGERQHCP